MDGTIRIRTVAWFTTAVVLSVLCTLLVTQAWSATAAPGDADSTFVPTAGCRVVDTRPAPATIGSRTAPLGAGDIFEVAVHGANGDCTGPLAIPTDAVAVALNVTAVNATARSNIRVYPADLVEVPLLSNLNVTAGAPPTPNKVDTKLSADGKIRVFNEFGSVNIFIDVVGYYTDAKLAALQGEIDAVEAANATQQTEIDALEVTVGLDPVTLGQGIDWESNGNNTSKVLVFESGTEIDGDVGGGTAHLSLIGPTSLDGGNYVLESVTYCVVAAGTGTVSDASIIGLTPEAGSLETRDRTDRTTNDCFTITPTPDVAATGAHQLMLFVLDTVLVTQVTATWTPA